MVADHHPIEAALNRATILTLLLALFTGFFLLLLPGQANVLRAHTVPVSLPLLSRWYVCGLILVIGLIIMWLALAYMAGLRYSRRLEQEVKHQTRHLMQSEEKARLESHRLGGILESIFDGVLVIDNKARVVLVNRAAKTLFHSRVPADVGKHLGRLLPPQILTSSVQREFYEKLLENPAQNPIDTVQVAMRFPGEDLIWVEVSAVPLQGASSGLVFAFRDITRRRQSEEDHQRAQKLEALGLLAGGIAHDFNNLLTIVIGGASLVRHSPGLSPDELKHLDRTLNASDRARKLTLQLLTFAKGGGPKLKQVDLKSLVRDSVTFSLSGSNVTCRFEWNDDKVRVELDEDQFAQVIGNLVINACQAMSNGGVLRVRVAGVKTQNLARIEIEDSGGGIPEKDLSRIFDPYFTTKAQGSGLGLAIANSIVEKHQGSISVRSHQGRGSVFRIELPLCTRTEAQGLDARGRHHRRRLVTSGGRILVMDDDQDICILMVALLTELGHQAVTTQRGEDAVKAFLKALDEDRSFDLAIVDLTVPGGMGGQETLQALRDREPDFPVIVTSGYSEDPVMARHEEFGFSGILAKPFSLEKLNDALARLGFPGVGSSIPESSG